MRRHLVGLLAGLLCAPPLWFGTAWAAAEVTSAVRSGDFAQGFATSGVGVLMLVGILGGLLAGSRLSPLAALLCGGLLLGFALWPLLDRGSLDAAMPGWLDNDSMFHPGGPALPVAVPLGALLFISALPPSRWRSKHTVSPPAGQSPLPMAGQSAPYPAGPVTAGPNTAEYDGAEGTTTPFQRGADGVPRPTRGETPDDSASTTQVFGEHEGR